MKHLVVAITLLLQSTVFALGKPDSCRGEAERKALHYFEMLPVWIQGCKANPELCFSNVNSGKITLQALQGYKRFKQIEFIHLNLYDNSCTETRLRIPRELLYFQNKESVSDMQIMEVVIQSILNCLQGPSWPITPLMAAEGFVHHSKTFGIVKGPKTDMVVSLVSEENSHKQMQSLLNCYEYTITNTTPRGVEAKCKANGELSLVEMDKTAEGLLSLSKFAITD